MPQLSFMATLTTTTTTTTTTSLIQMPLSPSLRDPAVLTKFPSSLQAQITHCRCRGVGGLSLSLSLSSLSLSLSLSLSSLSLSLSLSLSSLSLSLSSLRIASAGRLSRKVAVSVSPVASLQSTQDKAMPGGNEKKMKVVGVFYKAHEYAKDPKFLGCVENGLGLREFLESKGHTYIVTDDKEGENCELEKHIPDMDILITTPFHPAYMTAERINKAKNLKLLVTAGVGSDHVDLNAAAEKGLTVAEVSGSNVVSVAEDELMRILILLRNFLPAHKQVSEGGWNVAAVAYKAFDLQGKTVGTVGSGRIGQELLKRLKAFDCNLLYYARHSMGEEKEQATGATWESDLDKFLAACDVVSINLPLSDKTRGMFNKEVLYKMKKGAMLVNNARGAIVDVDAVKEACESGQLGGYSGDVWYPQPPPEDHCWRYMPNQAMTPHISGTTIDAQARYAEGTKEMLKQYFTGKPLPEENYIVREGELSSQYK